MKKFNWGHLKDHLQTCQECFGSGEDPDDEDEFPMGCPYCHGYGYHRWGSFYAEEPDGICDDCGENKEVSAMFEPGCVEWVCLKCYLIIHKRECGCNLWKEAEKAILKGE